LFPDFTTIENFREPLCAALRAHAQEIQDVQREMQEVTKMTAELRADLDRAKSK
jgi:hypothetical protein